jgi:hypothetical protein
MFISFADRRNSLIRPTWNGGGRRQARRRRASRSAQGGEVTALGESTGGMRVAGVSAGARCLEVTALG